MKILNIFIVPFHNYDW